MRLSISQKLLLMKFFESAYFKYLLSGLLNTLFTYVVYLILIQIFNYRVSYTFSYCTGIFTSYLLNTIFVFKKNISFKKIIKYPFVYLIQYVIGFVVMYYWVEIFLFNESLAPIFVIIITTPISFLLSKYIINKNFKTS